MKLTKDRAQDILDRLDRFKALSRPATDEVGWIALAYSCTRAKADAMIKAAPRAFVEQSQVVPPPAPLYPEHEKLRAVVGTSQAIGEFLDWAEGRTPALVLCSFHDNPGRGELNGYYPARISKHDLLAEFFGIDPKELEAEKRAMIAGLPVSP